MSTLERLKEMQAEYGSRPTMPPVHVALETWHALPKLLAVVEAAKILSEWLPCGPSVTPDEIKAWVRMDVALAAIDKQEIPK